MQYELIKLPILNINSITPCDALISANVIIRSGFFATGEYKRIVGFMDLINLIESSILYNRLICLPTGVPVGTEELPLIKTLAKEGISVRLLDMHTIKPIDKEAVIQAAKETGAIVTVEDSSIIGGLGGAVAEIIVESALVPMQRVGIKDRFGQTATPEELKEEYEISEKYIAQAVREVISRKNKEN